MKLTKIYTRTGDAGDTSLVGGVRVPKDSARLEAYGTMDELSSHLGLLDALVDDADIKAQLERIQNTLFNVCTYLATDTTQTPIYPSAQLPEGSTAFLEQQIDAMNESLPTLDSFVLPGGCQAAAQCHVCRTVCRRAERRIVSIGKLDDEQGADVLKYVNRLSDYLFVLARKLNFINHTPEKTWRKF